MGNVKKVATYLETQRNKPHIIAICLFTPAAPQQGPPAGAPAPNLGTGQNPK